MAGNRVGAPAIDKVTREGVRGKAKIPELGFDRYRLMFYAWSQTRLLELNRIQIQFEESKKL